MPASADDKTAPSSEAFHLPSESIPKPRITWKGFGIAAGLWILYTLLYSALIARAEDIPFVYAVTSQGFQSTILALFSIPVWWITIRRMDGMHWGWILGAHLVLAPLYAWSSLESYLGLMRMNAGEAVLREIMAQYQWILFAHFTLYIVQFAIYHTVRSVQRLRLKEQQAAELMTLAHERELEALKAQVNPHFLFNTLNSISATVKTDPDEAREMISELAHLLRYALDSAKNDWVTLEGEVTFAKAYLTLESHRFSDRLQVDYDIDSEILDTPVPPMVLQPLVENAVKHGIAPSERGGTITLRIHQSNEHVQVHVEDTGSGLNGENDPLAEETEGLGLANTNARLTQTYGPEAALHTNADASEGFEVWFTIPATGKGERKNR